MPISIEELQDTHLFEKAIWRLLARGVVDTKHPFRLCSIATINEAGKPDTRTVVLRACDIANKTLSFHTDFRSGKVAHLKNQPDVCMLFWDQKNSLQLRVYGKAEIHHMDEIAKNQLTGLPKQQLLLYGFSTNPGSILQNALTENFKEELVEQNFALVAVKINSIDALHLGREGIHTRIKFQYDANGLSIANFLKA